MSPDNTQARRDYLVREYGNLNVRIGELQATMGAYSTQKADVIRQLRATGLSVIEVADALGLTRQAIYNVLQADESRYDERADRTPDGPRRFLIQHLDMDAGSSGTNWTSYQHTLEAAFAMADAAYFTAPNPTQIRQEVIDTATGEWRFRNIGDMGWSPPTHGGRVPDVDMERLLSTGQQGRRSPEPRKIDMTDAAAAL